MAECFLRLAAAAEAGDLGTIASVGKDMVRVIGALTNTSAEMGDLSPELASSLGESARHAARIALFPEELLAQGIPLVTVVSDAERAEVRNDVNEWLDKALFGSARERVRSLCVGHRDALADVLMEFLEFVGRTCGPSTTDAGVLTT